MEGRTRVSANLREVMVGDLVGIGLPDETSGKLKIYALDLPESRECKRGMLISFVGAGRTAFETLELQSDAPQILTIFSREQAHMHFSRKEDRLQYSAREPRPRSGLLRVGRTAELHTMRRDRLSSPGGRPDCHRN